MKMRLGTCVDTSRHTHTGVEGRHQDAWRRRRGLRGGGAGGGTSKVEIDSVK